MICPRRMNDVCSTIRLILLDDVKYREMMEEIRVMAIETSCDILDLLFEVKRLMLTGMPFDMITNQLMRQIRQ